MACRVSPKKSVPNTVEHRKPAHLQWVKVRSNEDGPHPGVWAEEPGINGWVRDGVRGHQGVDAPRSAPYAPELNPVERFFRSCAGPSRDGRIQLLQAKQDALEPIPEVLAGAHARPALHSSPNPFPKDRGALRTLLPKQFWPKPGLTAATGIPQ